MFVLSIGRLERAALMANVGIGTQGGMPRARRRQHPMMRARWLATAILIMQIILVPAWAATTKVQGKHSMTGTITMIDHTTGMLTLKTSEGDLKLHFPPSTVQRLKEGDTITVHLSYSESSAAQ
jgi:hypothetical protein